MWLLRAHGATEPKGLERDHSPSGNITVKIAKVRAGEMAQWLRALTTLPKDLSSNPSNDMVAHNHL